MKTTNPLWPPFLRYQETRRLHIYILQRNLDGIPLGHPIRNLKN